MAFTSRNLSVLAYANNFTLWHYRTEDASVMDKGYFNTASDMLQKGDLIISNIDTDGKIFTQFYEVTDVTGGTVTVKAYAINS